MAGGEAVSGPSAVIVTSAVSNLIREGKTRQLRNAMQMALAAGNQTLEMSLNALVAAGTIAPEAAIATAFVPHEIGVPALSA